jgi:hypothetical protein
VPASSPAPVAEIAADAPEADADRDEAIGDRLAALGPARTPADVPSAPIAEVPVKAAPEQGAIAASAQATQDVDTESDPTTPDDRAAAAAAQTAALLARFRPESDAHVGEPAMTQATPPAPPRDRVVMTPSVVTTPAAEAAPPVVPAGAEAAPAVEAATVPAETPTIETVAVAPGVASQPETPIAEALPIPVALEPIADEPVAGEAVAASARPAPDHEPAQQPARAAAAPDHPVPVEAAPVQPASVETAPEQPAPPETASTAEPVAAERPREDRVETPTWRIVAPDSDDGSVVAPDGGPPPASPASPLWVQPPTAPVLQPQPPLPASPPAHASVPEWPTPAASAQPSWPTAPAWPSHQPRAMPRGADAVWAASNRDVLNRPETGVQACVNCGLALSSTARFCRRCGSSQVHA